MTTVVNTTESDRLFPDTGVRVDVGQPLDTDPETAADLLEQGWSKPGAQKPPKIDDVLDAVGDDPTAAAAALADEEARPSPRPRLIEKLSAVIAAGSPEGDDKEAN